MCLGCQNVQSTDDVKFVHGIIEHRKVREVHMFPLGWKERLHGWIDAWAVCWDQLLVHFLVYAVACMTFMTILLLSTVFITNEYLTAFREI